MLKISKCLCNYFSSVHCQDLAAAASVDSFCSIFPAEIMWNFLLGKFDEYILQLQQKDESQIFIFLYSKFGMHNSKTLTITAVFLPFPRQSHNIIQLLWDMFLLCQQKMRYHKITAYITSWSVGLLWLHFISCS